MDAYDMFRRCWRQQQQQQHQPDDEGRPATPPAAGFLRKSAITSLLVNHSYMRRVWTIQEAVAARDLRIWPLQGSGEVKAYQGKQVVDWPDFIAWNSQPQLEALNFAFDDKAVNGYLEGEYGKVISLLRQRPPGSIGHLALLSKDLMWITMDRSSLVESVQTGDGPAGRAYVVLNHHQVMRARSFLPADRVLALVPLVDYDGWREATAGVHSSRLVQASVAWAYDVMERGQDWRWSIRIYNSPSCSARSLDLLQPRRNLDDGTAVHGRAPGWRLQIPVKGGTFQLTAADPRVTADLSDAAATAANNNNNDNISAGTEAPPPPTAATAATAAGSSSLELCVLASLLMPHPGFAPNWSDEGGSWDPLRNVLRCQRGDDGFRLAVQWGLEPWRNPGVGFDMERSAVVVVQGEGLTHPALILMALEARGGEGAEAEAEPATAQVMAVVDVRAELLPEVLTQLRTGALRELTEPLKVVSAGVVPVPAAPLKTSSP